MLLTVTNVQYEFWKWLDSNQGPLVLPISNRSADWATTIALLLTKCYLSDIANFCYCFRKPLLFFQCDQIGRFFKLITTNFLIKVAKIEIFRKSGFFLGNFLKNWATFYFIIWSRCLFALDSNYTGNKLYHHRLKISDDLCAISNSSIVHYVEQPSTGGSQKVFERFFGKWINRYKDVNIANQ